MNANPIIPKEEQLKALAHGIQAFYQLIEHYTGNPIKTDFRVFATVSKADLADYFKCNLALAAKHVIPMAKALELHDHPVLLAEGKTWLVCWIGHGVIASQDRYDNLPEAAANFVMAYW